MNPEMIRAFETIAAFLFGAGFLTAVLKIAFAAGDMVRGQKEIAKTVAAGAEAFKKYAEKVDAILDTHDRELLEIQTEVRVRRDVEGPTRPRKRADDQHPGDGL